MLTAQTILLCKEAGLKETEIQLLNSFELLIDEFLSKPKSQKKPKKPKNQKKPKKTRLFVNGFIIYRRYRSSELRKIQSNIQTTVISKHVSSEWKELSLEQKYIYKLIARLYNKNRKKMDL